MEGIIRVAKEFNTPGMRMSLKCNGKLQEYTIKTNAEYGGRTFGVLGGAGRCGRVLAGLGSESNTRLVAPGESRECMPLNVMENMKNSELL